MPIVEPVDEYARPPRSGPSRGTLAVVDDVGVDVDGAHAELRDAATTASSLHLDEVEGLELIGCELTGTSFSEAPGIELELDNSCLTDVDLSRVRIRTARHTTFERCKLTGAELAGALLRDVTFSECSMQYTNVRMATLERVSFDGCRLHDVDFYESTMTDVGFSGSRFEQVTIDKCRFERVDLRDAAELDFTAPTQFTGVLIGEEQVQQLAYLFALASGVSIERAD